MGNKEAKTQNKEKTRRDGISTTLQLVLIRRDLPAGIDDTLRVRGRVPKHFGSRRVSVYRTATASVVDLLVDDWVLSEINDNPEVLKCVEERGTDGSSARKKTIDTSRLALAAAAPPWSTLGS